MNRTRLTGHLLATATILVWGVTYIASKVLLAHFTELQLLSLRFLLAYATLWVLYPKWRPFRQVKEELDFFLLSLFGVVIYYLCENMALSYTQATSVSILVSFAPIATAIGIHLVAKEKALTRWSLLGFAVAITGVILVVYNGTVKLHLNPLGDALSVGATLCWAAYSVMLRGCIKKYDPLLITRRMLFYSLVLMLPAMLLKDGLPSLAPLASPANLGALILLGVFGSGLCFVWWNQAITRIGVVVTTNYIYLSPFITMISAWLVLDEAITPMGVAGAVLIIGGVFLSDRQNEV